MALNQVGLERLGTSVTDKIGENKNLIINGAMQVSQRGTSFADSANGSYTLDRFNIQNSSGTPAFTVTQDTDAPHGFNNSLKVACTTADASPAAGSFSRIRHIIEAQNLSSLAKGTASAKAQTLSFYVKTNKTGVYTVFVYDDDNNRMFSASYTVSDTNWNRYTIDVPADTSGAINDDNGTGYVIHWGLSLGSNRTSGSLASTWATYATANEHVGNVNFADNTSNVWAITGVQLEVGSVATDFGLVMWLANRNPGLPHTTLRYKTQKRANPTVTIFNTNTADSNTLRDKDASTDLTPQITRLGDSGCTIHTNTSTALGNFIAFHYTATAEL